MAHCFPGERALDCSEGLFVLACKNFNSSRHGIAARGRAWATWGWSLFKWPRQCLGTSQVSYQHLKMASISKRRSVPMCDSRWSVPCSDKRCERQIRHSLRHCDLCAEAHPLTFCTQPCHPAKLSAGGPQQLHSAVRVTTIRVGQC
eukprot:6486527-Amphidinium_carterae.1